MAPESHHATTLDSAAARSPHNGNGDHNGNRVERAAFENLLTTDGTFFRRQSRLMAGRAARMRVPPSDIEDVVQEAWLEAVEYRLRFASIANEWRLHCWLMRVVHNKAVDALRRLGHQFCEPLSLGEKEPLDGDEAKRAEASEWCEWLTELLEKVRPGNEQSLRLLCAHFYQERSFVELAHESGLTMCAVDGRIRRLLRKLREQAE
ncbi:MAG TPA: sigma-70 family RNA polymerase sigma factor [Gemmataceae bacterium]